jgi:hypothetical protein
MGDVEMSLIKVGLEATREQLREELLSHPCKYFFILMIDNRAVLCIQTCNSIGENLQSHVVDGLVPDSDGNLVSVFEEELHLVIKDWRRPTGVLYGEELHSISPAIAEKIRFLPGFVDWIISTVLTKDRNILIYPTSWS